MGIDRIGKGGISGAPDALPKGADAASGKPFEVAPAKAPAVARLEPSEALAGVRSGQLDVKGYVDAKVDEAVAHLTHLTETQRDAVRSVVRAQLEGDPHLLDLVEQAAGRALPDPSEG